DFWLEPATIHQHVDVEKELGRVVAKEMGDKNTLPIAQRL
ncbi:unnamed protein product, partial [marine sediment metagenome]